MPNAKTTAAPRRSAARRVFSGSGDRCPGSRRCSPSAPSGHRRGKGVEHLAAHPQVVEIGVAHHVPMEVDVELRGSRGSRSLLRIEARCARTRARLVRLDFAALLLRVVLELPLGGAERLVDHPGGVIVGFVQALLAPDHDVAAGHADRDGDAERALVRLLVRRLDGDARADDAVVVAFDLGPLLAHAPLQRLRGRHVVKADLQRFLHDELRDTAPTRRPPCPGQRFSRPIAPARVGAGTRRRHPPLSRHRCLMRGSGRSCRPHGS